MTESAVLIGLFRDHESAQRAYQGLIDRGYEPDDVILVLSDESRAAECAAAGGALGALVRAASALGRNVALPGLGLIVTGPITDAAGAGDVEAGAGLRGALVDWAVPEARIDDYAAGLRDGGILIGVRPHHAGDAAQLERFWHEAHGEAIHC